MKQRQFLNVVDEETARRRFSQALGERPARGEEVPLEEALGRVLFEEVRAAVDVPGFDRSNVDGFAVRAADTFGADEEKPARLRLSELSSNAGRNALPDHFELSTGEALPVATGAVSGRGSASEISYPGAAVQAKKWARGRTPGSPRRLVAGSAYKIASLSLSPPPPRSPPSPMGTE